MERQLHQRYTGDEVALERMSRGMCPECGVDPNEHTGWGLGRCSLTDTGAAGRVYQYQLDQTHAKQREEQEATGGG